MTMNEERPGYMPIPTAEQVAEALANVRCFHDLSAELIAPELLRNVLAAAAHPAGCEAVVVVGIRISTDGFGSYIADSAMGIGAAMPGEVREPLMTVAQHQRILAASVPAGCKVVPVELLERAVYNMELAEMDGPTYRELRALLASAEGVKDE